MANRRTRATKRSDRLWTRTHRRWVERNRERIPERVAGQDTGPGQAEIQWVKTNHKQAAYYALLIDGSCVLLFQSQHPYLPPPFYAIVKWVAFMLIMFTAAHGVYVQFSTLGDLSRFNWSWRSLYLSREEKAKRLGKTCAPRLVVERFARNCWMALGITLIICLGAVAGVVTIACDK